MNKDLDSINFHEIKDINYSNLFPHINPTDVVLNRRKRREVVSICDERIRECESGLRLIYHNLEEMQSMDSGFIKTIERIHSFFFFTVQTTADCWVAFKYFILSDNHYDRCFMRGKLKVILNEGFKKLYGFKPKTKKESEWTKLSILLSDFLFPDVIYQQYQILTRILEEQSIISTWWKEERNCETHLNSFKLYESRQEVVNESKVMIDVYQLLNAFEAVDTFAGNLNTCIVNYLLDKYKKGELQE